MVLTSSIARVMGPTPPGTGVIQPATSLTPPKSTSPQSFPFVSVHADIDDDRPRLDHVPGKDVALADGRDDHVRLQRVGLEVFRSAVAHGHRRILREKHDGDRLADDVAASDHDGVLAFQVVADGFEHLHAAVRRAWTKAGAAHHQCARARDVEAIDVLGGRDGLDDLLRVHVLGDRQLDEDAVHLGVGVQRADAVEKLGLSHRCRVALERCRQARLGAVVDLVLRVDLARWVFADEDDRQVRLYATRLQCLGAAGDFGTDLPGKRVAVDELRSHGIRKRWPSRRSGRARSSAGRRRCSR